MNNEELIQKMAQLESMNDHLATEIQQADHLMRLVGFVDGLETIKATAIALRDGVAYEEGQDTPTQDNNL